MEFVVAPTVAIETHGCKLNQADSEILARQFLEAGYRLVSPNEPADVYVVNTCTVTHVADRKARQALRAAARRNPDAVVVATGCYARRNPGALGWIAGVDLVVGNAAKTELVRQVGALMDKLPSPCATGVNIAPGAYGVGRTRTMVKIQEGCDQLCAYCIVPKVRGRERSIPPEELLPQIEERVEEGYKEVVLTGTQLGSYGFDIPGMSLKKLAQAILDGTAVQRLRISSLQPQEVTDDFLDLWSNPRLCPHFHIPLQSGSNTVLRRMRRRYSAELYAERVAAIRQAVPDVAITTDVIIGFPGETEEEFHETYSLCQRVGFAGVHVFPYSVRSGTSAAHLPGRVDAPTKSRRMQRMLKLARAQAAAFRRRFRGCTRPVLWEGAKGQGDSLSWWGLTDNYIRVWTQGEEILTNRITQARLIKEQEDLMYAQVL